MICTHYLKIYVALVGHFKVQMEVLQREKERNILHPTNTVVLSIFFMLAF
jgi:hypothetical protein